MRARSSAQLRASFARKSGLGSASAGLASPIWARACSSSCNVAPAGPADDVTAARSAALGASTPQNRCLCRRGGVTSWDSRSRSSSGVSPCYMGIEPGTPRVLHWGDPGVTFKISWDGTDWVHEARWAGLPCASGCQYRFKVTSGLGNGVTTTSAQAKVIPALEYCMPDPDPNQQ